MSYDQVTFKDLSKKRKENVRRTIKQMWEDGFDTYAISRKVRIGTRSVATALGNLTRKV